MEVAASGPETVPGPGIHPVQVDESRDIATVTADLVPFEGENLYCVLADDWIVLTGVFQRIASKRVGIASAG